MYHNILCNPNATGTIAASFCESCGRMDVDVHQQLRMPDYMRRVNQVHAKSNADAGAGVGICRYQVGCLPLQQPVVRRSNLLLHGACAKGAGG
jgi:hypothetical protein